MNVKELKEILKQVPDDAIVYVCLGPTFTDNAKAHYDKTQNILDICDDD